MAANYNKVIQVGNLVRDPEVKFFENDNCVCKFTIANSYRYQSNGEWKSEDCFIDCEAWGRNAENIGQYMKKGSSILVEGRLKQNKWETPEGEKKSRMVVSVERQQFLDGGRKETDKDEGKPPVDVSPSNNSDDEPPF